MVQLKCNGKVIKCSVPLCTPQRIQTIFKLQNAPELLFLVGSDNEQEAIFWESNEQQWDPPLIDENLYEIPLEPESTDNRQTKPTSNLPMETIQQGLICSMAISESVGRDDATSFLNDNLKWHSISNICTTILGSPVTYGVFTGAPELANKKQIFVAFRGTTDRNDIKSDLTAFGIEKFKGKVHSGYWTRAACIPLEPFIQLLEEGNELIFCGHSMGGSIAQLVTLHLLEHIGIFSAKSTKKGKIFCVTFGSPFISTREVNQWINSINCQGNIVNIANPKDFVARLLDSQAIRKLVSSRNTQKILELIFTTAALQTGFNQLGEPIAKLASLVTDLSIQNIPKLDNIKNTLSDTVPTVLQSFMVDYQPLGIYGILSYPSEPGKNQLELYFEEDPSNIVKLLTLDPSIIGTRQAENHYVTSYWLMFMELSNNPHSPYRCKEFPVRLPPSGEEIPTMRRVIVRNRFPLSQQTRIVVTKNQQANRCKLVIHGENLCFLNFPKLDVYGIPIARTKSGMKQILLTQTPPPSTKAEFQCHLVPNELPAPYPTVVVVTHFDRQTYNITKIQSVEGLTPQEKSVDVLSPALFQKAYQRGLSEMIIFKNKTLLQMMYELELITLHSSVLRSTLEKDTKHATTVGTLGRSELIHHMMQRKEIQDCMQQLFQYFASSLVLRDRQNKRTYALIVAGGALFIAVGGVWLPVAKAAATGLAGMGVGMGAKMIRNKLKGEIEWNNISVLRAMLDELYINPKNNELSGLESSSIEYDCMMLEKALSKKAEPFRVLQKSVDELVDASPPLLPTWKEKLSTDSYIKAIERLKASCLLYEIRLKLTKQFFLGIVGPQNSGKTSLTNLLLGKTVEECGDDKHTTSANLYKLSNEVIIVDFAGQTSTHGDIANIANQCGAMVSGFVFLTDFRGDPENTDSSLIEQIAQFHCPILVCVNQVSRRSDSIPTKEKVIYYKEAWNNYIQSYLKEKMQQPTVDLLGEETEISISPVAVELTEFRDFDVTLESKGIRNVTVVYEWIQEQMKTLGFNDCPLYPSPSL